MSRAFESIRVGAFDLPQRFVMAPLTRNRAGAGGVPTDLNVEYYRQRASAGLIVTEVNQRQIATVDELNAMVGEAKEAGRPAVLFKVQDPTGASRFIAIRLS